MGLRPIQRRFTIAAATAIAAISFGVPSVFGQVRQQPPVRPSTTAPQPDGAAASDQPQTQIVSPYWNQGQQQHSTSESRLPTPSTPDELIGATVMAVPAAHAQQVAAKWTYWRIDHELNMAADNIRHDFLDSDEYTNAMNKLRDATAEYDRARAAAISDVQATDEYRAAMALHQDVTDQITEARDSEHPDAQRLLALAELKLSYVQPLRAVERERIEASGDVRTAREHLRAAADELARLEKGFAHQTRDSIDLTSLRHAREDAKIAYLTTNTYYNEMVNARGIATDYAVYTRNLQYGADRFGPGGYGYDPYGYGYGGFGYGFGSTFISSGFGGVPFTNGHTGPGRIVNGPGMGMRFGAASPGLTNGAASPGYTQGR